jgi:predicted pyridoxine 5'-phosphate oxidase superfamily flavin-nucleotide-binding protein
MSFATAILPKSNTRGPTVSNSETLSLFLTAADRVTGDMNNSSRVFTLAAQHAQAERGSAKAYERRMAEGFPDRVTAELAKFIAEQDTAFLATATADGAPYVQHRGGPKGFIKVIDDRTLGFADYRGNRQYITLANLSENDRAFLFLLDPGRRQRIKLWGRARVIEDDPTLIQRLFDDGYKARPERAVLFTIEAWDVNCSAHIVTRFTEAEIEEAFAVVQTKITQLEAENAGLRAAIAKQPASTSE